MKIMSLAIVSAAALLLLLGGGLSSTTSEGASITIDGTPGKTWADYPSPIALNNNDILTLKASAGDPLGPTVIQIAANANVTIIGDATKNFTNLRISEAFGDTTAHNVNITNLKITANGGEGYIHHMGKINLTGANEFKGNGNTGIYSDSPSASLKINSTSNGTLLADGGATQAGIYCSILSIEGNAKVTATSGGGNYGITMFGPSPIVAVAANASLTANAAMQNAIVYSGTSTLLGISCEGTIALNGTIGLYSTKPVSISGSGTITATGSINGLYVNKLTVNGTTINAIANLDYGIRTSVSPITLLNGAVLNASSGSLFATSGGSLEMGPGTTARLTNGHSFVENCSFTMFSAGQWVISGDASFAGGSDSTSSPANIDVAAGKTGTITLATAPGITAPAPLTLTEGYAATSTGAFTLTGLPAPTVTKTAGDAKITWNNGTKKLDVATGLASGSYPVDLKASNGATPDATITFTVTVNPSGGGTVTVTSVTVDPSTISVAKGATQTFAATVNGSGGTPSQAVTWSVEGKNDANTTITSAGLLTVAAGETATTLTVKATSVADTTKSGTASVTVTAEDPGGGGGEGGGGSNAILWVAIAAVIVVALLGLLFFLFKKP